MFAKIELIRHLSKIRKFVKIAPALGNDKLLDPGTVQSLTEFRVEIEELRSSSWTTVSPSNEML